MTKRTTSMLVSSLLRDERHGKPSISRPQGCPSLGITRGPLDHIDVIVPLELWGFKAPTLRLPRTILVAFRASEDSN